MAARSTSAPTLPQISVLTATASVSIDNLSPAQQRLADREAALLASSFSLQPPPRRRGRLRSHAACQTDETELGELVKNQDTLATVREELNAVRLQMMHCEARLRHELRQEMETRVRSHDARNADKLAFLRKRSDTHVGQVRAASRTRLSALQATHRILCQRVPHILEEDGPGTMPAWQHFVSKTTEWARNNKLVPAKSMPEFLRSKARMIECVATCAMGCLYSSWVGGSADERVLWQGLLAGQRS